MFLHVFGGAFSQNAESSWHVFSAKGATFIVSLGQRPRINEQKRNPKR